VLLRRKRIQLVNHRINGVLQFKNFSLYIHRDLFRKIAFGNGGGYLSNIAYLRG
jgi:hypothetical protein